jgi:hypothetical protein
MAVFAPGAWRPELQLGKLQNDVICNYTMALNI